MKEKFTRIDILAVMALVVLALIAGCHSTSLMSETESSYNFFGASVRSLWMDAAAVRVLISSNDSTYSDGSVRFSGDSLHYSNDAYWRFYYSADSISTGVNTVIFSDGVDFLDTVFTVVPGDVTDTVTGLPDNRVNPAGDVVTVDFTSAENAEGYVLAVALKDSLYTGFGFSQWISTQVTSATIPREAFRVSGALDPDTGWYYVYIYAYTDSPDSTVTHSMLPMPLPGNLSDNIADERFKGRFGSLVVSAPDSVHVVVL
ncbi:MAG TPA: hypothetical protein PLF13_10490 [candidate division Zixibacteria bacterium]|nr:hypothetical protein [candidate division Zixibacteria bacterium]